MPQDQRYGRRHSHYGWDDERDRDERGREDWRGGSRSYRSSQDESQGGYDHDRRQDRDYEGTLRAGNYGRYEEEEDRSYPERYRSGGGYGEQASGSRRGGSGSGMRGYGSYGSSSGGGYGNRSGSYGSGRTAYGGGSGGYGYGQGGGSSGGFSDYVSDYDRRYGGGQSGGGYNAERGYSGAGRNYGGGSSGQERGWWDRATDEVSSWFGDRDAERRRQADEHHRGRGPKNYTRSDDRIREDVSDRLTDDPLVDASEINVSVENQEVTLTGTVASRNERRLAEECAESVSGVKYVQNNLRVKDRHAGQSGTGGSSSGGSSSGPTTFGTGGTTTM